MEKIRKKIGIVCCSNGLRPSYEKKLHILEEILKEIGLEPVFSDCIYEENEIFSVSPKKRADALMQFYQEDEILDIFDLSGGDLANGILPYLDYERIKKSDKCFFGYSDLTTVLNAIYAKTGKASGLYQIRNLLSEYEEQHKKNIASLYKNMDHHRFSAVKEAAQKTDGLFQIECQFVQGQSMEGIVIGGNIRCFLKLAGTPYMPNCQGKVLLLESRSGLVPQMETFLNQLKQLGVFEEAAGILLGTFTQLEQAKQEYTQKHGAKVHYPSMVDLIRNYVREDLPVAVTRNIGHGQDAKAIMIGAYLSLSEK